MRPTLPSPRPPGRGARRMRGLSLVELMVAMVLGLFLIGGVLSVFVSTRQANRSTDGLSRLQENARIAFEMMARELRAAGGAGCGSSSRVANVVNLSDANTWWWADWVNNRLRGYESSQVFPGRTMGTGVTQRVAGTDAIVSMSGGGGGESATIMSHAREAGEFRLNTTQHGFVTGDILLVCGNPAQGGTDDPYSSGHDAPSVQLVSILQATAVNGDTVATTTSGGTPGNCTQFLNPYIGCASVSKQGMAIEGGGIMSRLSSAGWYVGYNPAGGRSLYRVGPGLAGILEPPEEVADGVTDMQVQYLTGTEVQPGSDYVDATAVSNWDNVFAVRIVLTLESRDGSGQSLQRTLAHTVALRNRLP